MALADALVELAARWPAIHRTLDPSTVQRIREQLARAVHGGPWEPGDLMQIALVNAPEDHPVWEALAASGVRRGGTSRTIPVSAAAAALRLAIEHTADDIEAADADEADRAAEERLWSVPMTAPPASRERGPVLVLVRGGKPLAPRFQFDEDGALLEGVATINRILDVENDPWGTASWWLTPHASLHAIPADEVRVGSVDNVVAAAQALDELP